MFPLLFLAIIFGVFIAIGEVSQPIELFSSSAKSYIPRSLPITIDYKNAVRTTHPTLLLAREHAPKSSRLDADAAVGRRPSPTSALSITVALCTPLVLLYRALRAKRPNPSLAMFSSTSSLDDSGEPPPPPSYAPGSVRLPGFVRKVCIVGGGNAAQGLAALLSAAGVPVNVWDGRKDHAARMNAALETHGGIEAVFGDGRSVKGRPDKVSKDPAEVIPECNVILIPLPSFAYADVFAELAQHLQPGTYIGVSPGQGGFDWAARQALGDVRMQDFVFFALFPMPLTCQIREFGRTVDVQVVKRKYRIGATPPTAAADCCALVSAMFNAVVEPLPHLLATTLYPINGIIHPGRMFGICLRWRPDRPLQYNPLFYEEMDEASAGIMDCLNAEVQLIGDAIQRQAGLDLQLPHVCDFLGWVYAADRPDRSSTGAFFRSVPSYRFVRAPLLPVEGGLAPDFKDRYLSEDVPYGLCVYKGIAEIVGCDTPVIDMVIGWAQKYMGKEFLVDGRLAGRDVGATNAPQRFGVTTLQQLLSS